MDPHSLSCPISSVWPYAPLPLVHINIAKLSEPWTGQRIPTSQHLLKWFSLPGMLSGQLSPPQRSLPWLPIWRASPTPIGAHHSFTSFLHCHSPKWPWLFICWLVSSLCLQLERSTKGKDSICCVLHCILSSLNSVCHSSPPCLNHATAPLWWGPCGLHPDHWTLPFTWELFLLWELLAAAATGRDAPPAGQEPRTGRAEVMYQQDTKPFLWRPMLSAHPPPNVSCGIESLQKVPSCPSSVSMLPLQT